MSTWPLISAIVLNYNGHNSLGMGLGNCLSSVFSTDYPNYEVLFVDNASTDDSLVYVSRNFGKNSRLRIVRNDKNFGFAEGNNTGIRKAKGEYVVLLNNDTIVEPEWLKELVIVARADRVGAVQSKLLMLKSPELIDCAGGLIDYYGYHFERGRGEESSKYCQVAEVFYAKGAATLLKREALEKSGLFDPDIFLYFDEADLCWRIRLSGERVLFAPKSIVYHAQGLTASSFQEQRRLFFYIRNHLMVLLKNYDLGNMFWAVAASVLYEMRNASLFLVRRKPLVSLAIVKALVWNVFNLRSTWKKRQTVQRLVRKISDKELKKVMLEPFPPFPLYLVFSRLRYFKNKQNVNT